MTDAAFWDRIAPKYAKSKISDPGAYEETLARMSDLLQPDMRVLEVGCGTGSTALRLADKVAEYHGTDVAPGMIDIARQKQDEANIPNLSFSVAGAGEAPDGPYDAVIGLNLLHLLPELEADLARTAAMLRSGGLYITKTALLRDAPWYVSLMIPVMQAFGRAPFVRKLDQNELLALLERSGFEVTETLMQSGMAPRIFVVARKK